MVVGALAITSPFTLMVRSVWGEIYWKDGIRRARYTEYNTDGTEEKYDW